MYMPYGYSNKKETRATRKKIDKWAFIKIKNFVHQRTLSRI